MDLGSTSLVPFATTGPRRTIRISLEFPLTFVSFQGTCFALLTVEVTSQATSKTSTDSERATTAAVCLMNQLPLGLEMMMDLSIHQILDVDSLGLPGRREDNPLLQLMLEVIYNIGAF